ncbi:MAG: rod shape-determining protein MreC [Saprospiraceae bacterium]|nr:rod shape-determining protein MreC [Saprospiraceae bacterium]MDP4812089.1 rod shape-determining protein MreC [Saprospiraceae bacterium]MDP4852064.1 rod shape-determining protein MreC [Saprospiraceae bacterium]MDP4915804.1 rod shape-determining protein MreC [Saprospiraceae bacterium]MDP5047216.1 rod shape-determining protein MreC [Saprospiraceae bacterium]
MLPRSKVFSELGNLILFLLLEGISFYLIITYNDSQAKIYHNTINVISGNIANQASNIRGYFSLKEQNSILLKENAKLKAKLFNLTEKQGVKPEDLDLTVAQNQVFNLVSARVVNNSISLRNNFLSLNKGRKAGINENQGVIGENGVIGITKSVNDNYTTVMSIFNSQTKISARIKDKGYFGSLVWSNNGDVRFMTLNDIPKHVPIKLGDKVETSGYSNLFPSGIMLGKIVGKKIPPGSSTYELKVKLYQDMTKIKFAYVVINYETPALDSLYLQTKSL